MNLKFKYDKSKDEVEDIEKTYSTEEVKEIERHNSPDHPREICFEDLTGKQTSFAYSYLMRKEFLPVDNLITLFFADATVKLKGKNLQGLFEEFRKNIPNKITCIDNRYLGTKNENDVFVSEISIETS